MTSTGSFLRIGGSAHHVVVEGSGPVCVLSAGLGMSWFDWDPVVPLLAPFRTVVRFDRPGHGLSAPAPAATPPTAAGEAHRIAAILDELDLDDDAGRGRVTVVGHSVAGFHAEAFARLYPARTASVVLVDSSVEEHARAPAAPALRTAVSQALGTVLSAAGVPAALGPLARRTAVRASRTLPRGDGSSTGGGASSGPGAGSSTGTGTRTSAGTGTRTSAGSGTAHGAGAGAGAGPSGGIGNGAGTSSDNGERTSAGRSSGTSAGTRTSASTRADPAPPALVRRTYRTSRVLRGALRENTHYRAVAAGLLGLRDRFPLPEGIPVTVLAAYDGRGGRGSLRWLERQRGLATVLGARFEVAQPSGHLVMLDRPDAVVRAVMAVRAADG